MFSGILGQRPPKEEKRGKGCRKGILELTENPPTHGNDRVRKVVTVLAIDLGRPRGWKSTTGEGRHDVPVGGSVFSVKSSWSRVSQGD